LDAVRFFVSGATNEMKISKSNKLNITGIILILTLLMVAFTFASCDSDESQHGAKVNSPSELAYLDEEITINGVSDEPIILTVSDLLDLESVKEKAEATRSNGDIVKITAVGPLLDTFLEKYGKSQTDFSAVRFYATDGYAIALPKEMLESRNVILAYMDGSYAFDEHSLPLRVVIPGERAMYWARNVNRIDFEAEGESSSTQKVVFLDAALPDLKGEFSEEEGGDIVSTKILTDKYGIGAGSLTMSASDGLTKNETLENFLKGYIKYTGEKIPMFCSPDLPEGMNLETIVFIRTGNVLYYSLDQAKTILREATSSDGKVKGLGITEMMKGNSLEIASSYELTSRDGKTTSFFEHGLVGGVFVKDGDTWNFYADEDTQVKDVIMLEAVK
jgi:hypothetical protein